MITAQEARTIAEKANGYDKYLPYYQLLIDERIRVASSEGKRDCIVHIKDEYSLAIANVMFNILIENGYSVRPFHRGNKYGLWIFW